MFLNKMIIILMMGTILPQCFSPSIDNGRLEQMVRDKTNADDIAVDDAPITACTTDAENNNIAEAEELYQSFLEGEISVGEVNIDYITIPTGEPDRRRATKYTYYDMNGDSIPEFHINSGRHHYIFTMRDHEMIIWNDFHPEPYRYSLKNGAVMAYLPMGGEDAFSYTVYDYFGKEIWRIGFSVVYGGWGYSENDTYFFEGVTVSEELWLQLTKEYLGWDENGIRDILNQIEGWKIFCEAK